MNPASFQFEKGLERQNSASSAGTELHGDAMAGLITLAERCAVFTAHGSNQGTRCWLCYEPVSLVDMEVDHIIPEYLTGTEELPKVLCDFGLPTDFDLDSFENWLPAHHSCNRQKRNHVFKPTPLIQLHIERAHNKAAKAREICSSEATKRQIEKAIGILATSNTTLLGEHERALREILDPLLQQYATSNSEPIQVTATAPRREEPPLGFQVGLPERVFHYVPPSEVHLAPNLTVTFVPNPLPQANGPFTYTFQTLEPQIPKANT